MRPFRLGLLAALMAAFLMPAAAMAQKKSDKGAEGYNAAQMKRGAAEGAAQAQAAGVPCTVSNAAWVGSSAADKKTSTPAREMFEVACSGSMGFMIQSEKAGPATGFSCLESLSGLACKLPENANPAALLQAAITKRGVACELSQTRLVGQVPTSHAIYFEALCKDGVGYVIKTTLPLDLSKPINAEDCLIYDVASSNVKCTLAEPASRLAVIDRFVTAAKITCPIKERRFVGPLKDGTTAYEASCQDGKGYVLKVDAKGAVVPLECAKVPTLCELSDARQAMTEQAGLYTNLAKAAGSSCVVESYAVFPAPAGQEVLELTCKGGAEVVGVFPARGVGKVYDCGHALVAGFKCAPGKLDYAPLTADLRKLGKTDCSVSEITLRGNSAKGNSQIEVACADGLPGYVVEYSDPATPVEALGCRLVGCNLAANKKPKA